MLNKRNQTNPADIHKPIKGTLTKTVPYRKTFHQPIRITKEKNPFSLSRFRFITFIDIAKGKARILLH